MPRIPEYRGKREPEPPFIEGIQEEERANDDPLKQIFEEHGVFPGTDPKYLEILVQILDHEIRLLRAPQPSKAQRKQAEAKLLKALGHRKPLKPRALDLIKACQFFILKSYQQKQPPHQSTKFEDITDVCKAAQEGYVHPSLTGIDAGSLRNQYNQFWMIFRSAYPGFWEYGETEKLYINTLATSAAKFLPVLKAKYLKVDEGGKRAGKQEIDTFLKRVHEQLAKKFQH